jgi:glycerophosphoryl diester phosphodiesterase
MKYMIVPGLFCLFIASISGCSKPVEITAHRGASYIAPENTMASVMLGWEKNAGVTKELADAVKASGWKLYVWTVDDPEEANRLIKLGADGITTNRPGWLREQLKDHAPARQIIAGQ